MEMAPPIDALPRDLQTATGPAASSRRDPRLGGTHGPPPPQVERLVTFFSGGRYVFFSIAATAVAVASTYQSVRTRTLQGEAVDGGDDGAMHSATARFVRELLNSRLSSTIVLHFYFVVLYHIFLGVTHLCFGAIRRPEIQQTKETILHFLLMRSLLLASTIGGSQVRPPVELLLIWLSIVAFLRGILSICGARFDYLLTRPMTRAREFHRLAVTLLAIMAVDATVALICTYAGVFSTTVVHLTWFEASLFLIKASQLGTKVVFHVFDVGNVAENGMEKGELYLLLLQTALSGAHLVQLVTYYLYIISVDNFRVSFMDFILILNVKTATVELLEKVKQVQTYQQVVVELDELFPDATQDELEAVHDDVCVICLKSMDTHAKKLQCGHLFHRFCLRQCLQKASVGDSFAALTDPANRAAAAARRRDAATQGSNRGARSAISHFRCPLCRKSVSTEKAPLEPVPGVNDMLDAHTEVTQPPTQTAVPGDDVPNRIPQSEPPQPPVRGGPPRENVLRISTEFLSRRLPFIPNLSFEIIRPPAAGPFEVTDEMIRRVVEVFPQFSPETIRRDLLRTRSAERTIERVLSGRLQEQGEGDADVNAFAAGGGIDDDLRWDLSMLWDAVWGNQPGNPQRRFDEQQAARNQN